MNAPEITAGALAKLEAHERSIGRLYQAFAERFPEQAAFWSHLAREQEDYARRVESLRDRMQDDPTDSVAGEFPTSAVEQAIACVEDLTVKAARAGFKPLNAVAAALSAEAELLINGCFQTFETDRSETKAILRLLETKSRSHCMVLRQAWQVARGRSGRPMNQSVCDRKPRARAHILRDRPAGNCQDQPHCI